MYVYTTMYQYISIYIYIDTVHNIFRDILDPCFSQSTHCYEQPTHLQGAADTLVPAKLRASHVGNVSKAKRSNVIQKYTKYQKATA